MLLGESGGGVLMAPRKKEVAGPKQKQRSVVDVSGDEIRCCKEQHCIGNLECYFKIVVIYT